MKNDSQRQEEATPNNIKSVGGMLSNAYLLAKCTAEG